MANDPGFRVDRLADLGMRTSGRADQVLTVLDNPWISIWMSPRDTMKRILKGDPKRHVIVLGALAGGITLLNFFLSAALGFLPTPPPAPLLPYLPVLTLTAPFLGAGLGIAGVYLGGFAMEWCGRALGGVGNAVNVRAAVAWSQVPEICFSIAVLLILLGSGVWQAVVPALPDPNAGAVSTTVSHFTTMRGLEAIVSLWSFVVMLHCVGEAHRFSAWRALGAALLPGAILFGLMLIVAVALH